MDADISARWAAAEAKTEAIAQVRDPIDRNRQINGAYAGLYLDRPELQWAGMAAFASKEVGVEMKDFRTRPIRKALADANVAIFRDMHTVLTFYRDNIAELGQGGMQSALDRMPDDKMPPLIRRGMDATLDGDSQQATRLFLQQEQREILQPSFYADRVVRRALDVNQATGNRLSPVHLGIDARPASALAPDDPLLVVQRREEGPVYNYDKRMAFIGRAQDLFATALGHPQLGPRIEADLRTIRTEGEAPQPGAAIALSSAPKARAGLHA